jgi:hypothetical protein
MSNTDCNAKRDEIPPLHSKYNSYNIFAPFLYWARNLLRTHHTLPAKKTLSGTVSEPELKAFRYLVDQAQEIHRINPDALPSFVAAILRPLQSEQILSVAEREEHGAVSEIELWRLFSEDAFFSMFDERDCLRHDGVTYRLKFSRDVVLTTPWRRDRFADALALIGEGKKTGVWKQDPIIALR